MKNELFENSARRIMMMALLSMLVVMPVFAQYARPTFYHGRQMPLPRQHRSMTDIYYGVRLGLDISTVNSDDKYLDGGTAKSGLNVGFAVGFQVAMGSPIYFETGLSYMEKGGKGNYNGDKFSYNLNYLEVPLLMKYVYNVDRDLSIQPFFGGYLATGVGGKIKDFQKRKAYSSYDADGFQRFDGGLRFGCGLQYDYLYVEAGYDLGLSNICRDYFDTSHNGCFYASIGLNF